MHPGGRKSRPGVPDGFRLELHFSTGFLHLLLAVHAQDINILRSTDRLTTAGTNVLAGTAGLFIQFVSNLISSLILSTVLCYHGGGQMAGSNRLHFGLR